MAKKDEKFYWLKLDRHFFDRHDIKIVKSMPNGKDYIIFYLQLLCESIDHKGNLMFSDTIPYNEEMLASLTNTNVDIVRSAVKVFSELKMLEIQDTGNIYMTQIEKMIGSETYWAKQKRIEREKENVGQIPTSVQQVSNSSISYSLSISNSNKDNNIIEDLSWFLDKYNIQVDSYNGELSSYDFKKLDEYMQKSSWLRDYIKCTSTLCKLYHKIMTGQYNDMKYKKADSEEMGDREYLVRVGKFSQEYVDGLTDDEAKEKSIKWKKLVGGNV